MYINHGNASNNTPLYTTLVPTWYEESNRLINIMFFFSNKDEVQWSDKNVASNNQGLKSRFSLIIENIQIYVILIPPSPSNKCIYRRLVIEPSSYHFVECIFQGEKIGFKKKKVGCHEGKLVPYPIHDINTHFFLNGIAPLGRLTKLSNGGILKQTQSIPWGL